MSYHQNPPVRCAPPLLRAGKPAAAGIFALPAGYGDAIVGLTALLVGIAYAAEPFEALSACRAVELVWHRRSGHRGRSRFPERAITVPDLFARRT
jgi:hypothetical protein